MDHIFIYALPTDQSKSARLSEISAVRAPGFGPYHPSKVQHAFTSRVTPAITADAILRNLYSQIDDKKPCVLVSYNAEITKSLIRIEHDAHTLSDPFATRAWIDLKQLAWPMLITGQIADRGIATLATHFGVTLPTIPDSADVCSATLQIYGLMMRRYQTALKGESFVRDAGGESLQGLREMLKF